MKRPYLPAAVLGVFMIIASIAMLKAFPAKMPWMPEGMRTPILAFELLRGPGEVELFFGWSDPETARGLARSMDTGNRLDYFYMAIYASFLFLFAYIRKQRTDKMIYVVSMFLAAVILFADGLENRELLALTEGLGGGGLEGPAARLQVFTWIKWGGIALYFLTLAPGFWKDGKLGKVLGVAGFAAPALCLVAWLFRGAPAEIYGLLTAILFLLLAVFSLVKKEPKGPPPVKIGPVSPEEEMEGE